MASDQQIGLTASAPIGSLQREWRRCGKATCRCTNGMLHGPYWYDGETAVGNDGGTFHVSGLTTCRPPSKSDADRMVLTTDTC